MMGIAVRTYMNPEWFTFTPDPAGGRVSFAGVKSEHLKDVQNAMKERIAQQRAADIDQSKRFDINPDVRLTQEQMDHLKENYDPTDMTQEQYNAFIKDLEAFGVLSGVDSTLVGADYGSQLIPLEYCVGAGVCAATELGTTLDSYQGDALAWTKYRASFLSADPDTGKFYRNKQSLLFGKLENVLRRMQFSA